MGRKKKEPISEPITGFKPTYSEVVPNCAKCKWHLYIEHLLYFWNKRTYSLCTACGMHHPGKSYGSENCKKNYEKKEGIE